jgi:hypothetical protein
MAVKVRIGSAPEIDARAWQYLKLKYHGNKQAAKKLGISERLFRDVSTLKKRNIPAATAAKVEKKWSKLPADVRRHSTIAADMFKEATPKQIKKYMPQMTSTRKGLATLNKHLDRHEKRSSYSPFGRNRFGSPKVKAVRR